MHVTLKENERIDDLQYKGLKIIQKKNGFCFGIDAVLLANFADIKKNGKAVDLGTGTGIIPILLAGKTEASSITGIEIQEEVAEMAQRSVILNDLSHKIDIKVCDIKDSVSVLGKSKFDLVVSNPPYIKYRGGIINESDTLAISRHEIKCTLEDVVSAASKLLTPGGQFAMVHRPERLVDVMFLMRTYQIEPKYIRFVHPYAGKRANLMLVKGTKGGNPELKMLEPLYVYDENGNYSEEINRIYCRGEYKP